MPYDIQEKQVWDFFGDLKITRVDIPREDEDGRLVKKSPIEVLKKVRMFPVCREQAIMPMERTAIGYLFLPLKLGTNEQGTW